MIVGNQIESITLMKPAMCLSTPALGRSDVIAHNTRLDTTAQNDPQKAIVKVRTYTAQWFLMKNHFICIQNYLTCYLK